MTDNMIRMLTIAASVFLVVATISAGILYYTTVINVTDQFSDRTDISRNYEYALVASMQDKFDLGETITGIDARNLVYTLQGSGGFSINIVNASNQVISTNINNTMLDNSGSIRMFDLQKLIHPNATVTMKKFETINNIMNINLYIVN